MPGKSEQIRVPRKLVFKALVLILGGILILSAALGTAWIFIFSGQVRTQLLAQINGAIPGEILFDQIQLRPLEGAVTLTHLVLKDLTGTPVVQVPDLSLSWAWAGLLQGEVRVKELTLAQPRFGLVLDKTGQINLLAALIPEGGGDPEKSPAPVPRITIDQVRILGAELDYSQAAAGFDLRITGLDSRITEVDLDRISGRLDLSLSMADLDWQKKRFQLAPFRLACRLDQRQLTEIRLETEAKGLTLAVEGSVRLDQDLGADLQARMTLDLEKAADLVRGLDLPLSLPQGKIALTSEIQGPLANPSISLAAGSDRLFWQGIPWDRPELSVNLSQGRLTIQRVATALGQGQATLSGNIALEQISGSPKEPGDATLPAYDLALDLNGISLGHLPLPAKDVKGLVSGRMAIKGRGLAPRTADLVLTAGLRAEKASGFGLSPLDLDSSAAVSLSQGRIRADKLVLKTQGLSILGQGDLGLEDLNLRADLNLIAKDLSRFQTRVLGALALDAKVQGSLPAPQARIMAKAEKIVLDKLPLGDITLEGLWKKGILHLDNARLINQNSSLSLAGQIRVQDKKGWRKTPELTLEKIQGILELADFFTGCQGVVALSGQAQGPALALSGQGRIEAGRLDLFGRTLDQVRASVRVDRGTLFLDQAKVLANANGQWVAGGKADLQTLDLWTEVQNLDLGQIAQVQVLERAVLSGKMTAQGSWKAPRVQGQFQAAQIRAAGQTLPDLNLRLDLVHPRADLLVDAGGKEALVVGLDLSAKTFTADLSLPDQKITPLLHLAGQPELTGELSASVRASGQIQDLPGLKARLDLSRLEIRHPRMNLLSLENLVAKIDDQQLLLSPVTARLGPSGSLNLQGSGRVPDQIDLTLLADLPMDLLPTVLDPVVSAAGRLLLKAEIKGHLADPEIRAQLDCQDLALTLDDLEPAIEGIKGAMVLDRDRLEIRGIKGRMGEGEFELRGTARLDNWRPGQTDLSFKALALPLGIPETAEVTLTSDLNLKGDLDNLVLDGKVLLVEGLYYKDINLNPVLAITGQEKRAAQTQLPEALARARLNIQLTRRQPFLVENNLAVMEISPDLLVRGTMGAPVVSGRAKVETGTVSYLGTAFEITRGVIDFANPYRIEPLLDIQALTEIRDWTVTLDLSGPPDNLKFSLSSSPAEEHGDILSLLAFGKTTRELRVSDGGVSLGKEQLAALLMLGELEKIGKLGKEIKEMAGLDQFEVKTKDSGTGGVNVTLGADLSRQISVQYGVDVQGGETVQRMTTIYKLLEQLLLKGFQDTGGTFGGELKYRLEFR